MAPLPHIPARAQMEASHDHTDHPTTPPAAPPRGRGCHRHIQINPVPGDTAGHVPAAGVYRRRSCSLAGRRHPRHGCGAHRRQIRRRHPRPGVASGGRPHRRSGIGGTMTTTTTPRACAGCGTPLRAGEHHACPTCIGWSRLYVGLASYRALVAAPLLGRRK